MQMRHDAEAVASACSRARHADPQAHLSCHRHRFAHARAELSRRRARVAAEQADRRARRVAGPVDRDARVRPPRPGHPRRPPVDEKVLGIVAAGDAERPPSSTAAVEQALAANEEEQAEIGEDVGDEDEQAEATTPTGDKETSDYGPEGQSLRLPPRCHDRLKSRWFDDRNYQDSVVEDWKVRDYLMTQLEAAAVSRIEIERTRDRLRIDVHTARPGIVIGRRGAEADRLNVSWAASPHANVQLNIQEIKQPELDAALMPRA